MTKAKIKKDRKVKAETKAKEMPVPVMPTVDKNDIRITKSIEFMPIGGDLLTFDENCDPIGLDGDIGLNMVIAGELFKDSEGNDKIQPNLKKFQYGIVSFTARQKGQKDIKVNVHLDILMSMIYTVYEVRNPYKRN